MVVQFIKLTAVTQIFLVLSIISYLTLILHYTHFAFFCTTQASSGSLDHLQTQAVNLDDKGERRGSVEGRHQRLERKNSGNDRQGHYDKAKRSSLERLDSKYWSICTCMCSMGRGQIRSCALSHQWSAQSLLTYLLVSKLFCGLQKKVWSLVPNIDCWATVFLKEFKATAILRIQHTCTSSYY